MTRTEQILKRLRDYESRNVTCIDDDGSWPIVWESARGMRVKDVEGRRYLDLTAAFGVAATGHANPAVVRAGQRQMTRLLHAMGDVHPHPLKGELAQELSRITFERWSKGASTRVRGKTIFCNSGFEAVEAALKTARLATGKPGIIAFHGAYHGAGYGALNATHRDHFRAPFRDQLKKFGHFVPFPNTNAPESLAEVDDRLQQLVKKHPIGAVLVEPIQARGGINIPPPEFLPLLRRCCDNHGLLLILDEIYTGFGRTGKWFACEHANVIPDLVCLGKALTGGFPLSACAGDYRVMDAAWPLSQGEAIHTSTFLGHPVGCAMALAQIAEIRRLKLIGHSAGAGKSLLMALQDLARETTSFKAIARGVGLMAGLELCHADGSPATEAVIEVMKEMLRRGFLLLPEGEYSQVISLTPPLTISVNQLHQTLKVLRSIFTERGWIRNTQTSHKPKGRS